MCEGEREGVRLYRRSLHNVRVSLEAAEWYQKAADQGNADTMFRTDKDLPI